MGALCEIPGSGNMGLSGVQPALELVLGPQPPLMVQPTSTVSTLCSLAFLLVSVPLPPAAPGQ